MTEETIDNRTEKIKYFKKVLSCSRCLPHKGENRKRVNKHKTRKNRNYQYVIKK